MSCFKSNCRVPGETLVPCLPVSFSSMVAANCPNCQGMIRRHVERCLLSCLHSGVTISIQASQLLPNSKEYWTSLLFTLNYRFQQIFNDFHKTHHKRLFLCFCFTVTPSPEVFFLTNTKEIQDRYMNKSVMIYRTSCFLTPRYKMPRDQYQYTNI